MNNVIASEQKRFYVYGLFDRGVPFYIGKGKDKRAYNHVGEARCGSNRPVHKKIRAMNFQYETKILCSGLTETDAYELEELAIKTVGRRYDDAGPLLNLTSGGQGGMAGYVVVLTPEQRAKQHAAMRTPEARARMTKQMTGRFVSKDTRAKLSLANKGKIIPQEMRDRISKTKQGICNYIPNAQQRAAISQRLRGRPVSDDTKKRISEGVKRQGGLTLEQRANQQAAVQKKVTCPHCTKTGANSIMRRWHFDNCKFKVGVDNEERKERK